MNRVLAVSVCSTLALLAGCDQVKRLDEGGTGSGSAVPDAVQQVLTARCATAGCHVAGATSPDLSASAAGAWVSQSAAGKPLVTFGDVGNSYLVEKMLPAPSAGGQMPPGGGIEPEEVSLIIGWVAGVDFPTGDTDNPTSGADGSGDTGDTMEPTTGSAGSSADLTLCSLEAIDSSVTSPVDAGDEAGKIPASVGAALERNCGCHYVTTADPPYVAYSAGTQLQTLANFTDSYGGANTMYTGMPGWVAVQDRVINQQNMPMALCETDEGTVMTAEDFALFEAWFEQEAPDGANFTPP